jgi:DNA-binding HxlR family transcriptional regulator
MLKNDYPGQNCSIARSLEIVGERWTLLIVRELIRGPRRFLEIERATGIAKNVLAKRLERMAAEGLLNSTSVSESRDWVDYRLTKKGSALFPVLHALIAWGDTYASPNGPPLTLIHRCGGPVGHKTVCECCGESVRIGSVRAVDN